MNYERIDRISEEVRREIDKILREEIRDPRVTGTWSLTRVEVTRDLRYAKVRVSVLEDELRAPLLKALKSAAGYIRRGLGRSLSLRYTPEILFETDENIAYGVHISSLLADMLPETEEADRNEDQGAIGTQEDD